MAGYTRNDTSNNIADGNVINAADLDGEFDSLQTAFNETSGHTHDGTVGEGAPISVVGPAQDINVTITEVVPKTTNTMSLGTAALQFKDLYIDGTANIDSLVADTADINAGTIDNAVIGGATPEAATFTTLTATDAVSLDDAVTINESAADVDFRVEGVGKPNALFVQGSDGNVGVNTNSPTTTLDVNGTVKASVLNVAGSSSLDGAVVVNETGADVDFRVESDTNANALFVQGSNGAVGIGTSSPLSQLEVSDTDGATGINVTAYRNLTAYGNSYVQFNGPRFDTADQDAVIGRGAITLLGNAADTSSSMWISAATASLAPATATEANMQGYNAGLNITSDGELGFWDSGTERFTITSAGNVGINKASPASTLDVNGTVTATGLDLNGDADLGGQITLSRTNGTSIKRTTDTDFLSLLSGTTTALGANIVMYGGSNVSLPNWNVIKGDNILFQPVDGSPVYLNLTDGTGAIFNEGGADVDFRIESDTNTHAFFLQGSDGNVGIGDSAPPTILSVRGDAPESRITNTNAISDSAGTEEIARLGVYGQKNSIYGPAANIVFRQDASTWSSVDAYQKGTRIEFCTQDTSTTDTSETPRMVIDKDGLVGIGTDNPTEKLHLSQDSGFAIQMERTGASPSVCEIANSGSLLNISNDANGITFLTGGTPTEAMRVKASGNVGIGTSDPQALLDVTGASGNQLVVATNTNAADTEVGILFKHATEATNHEGGGVRSVRRSSLNDFGLALDVGRNSVSTEAMFISGADATPGYVGIGTSSPSARLEVADTDGASGIEVSAYRNDTTYGNSYIKFNGPRSNTTDGNTLDGRGAITLLGNSSSNAGSLWINAASATLLPETADEATMQGYQAGINLNSDGELSFWDNGSQRFLISSTGNVGIGTSSPSAKLEIDAGSATGTQLQITTTGFGHNFDMVDGRSTARIRNTDGSLRLSADNSNEQAASEIVFLVDGSEKMWITNSGKVGIGTDNPTRLLDIESSANVGKVGITGYGLGAAVGIYMTPSNDSATPLRFNNASGTQIGSITTTDTATAYNTSSDYRLKEDVQPITGASERVLKLNPVNFAWKSGGTRVDGFIAHEAQEVVPEAVHGVKDGMQVEEYEISPAVKAVYDEEGNLVSEAVEAVMGTREVPDYQGIDQGKLVPLLTAALQEALTEISNLKARVATLEG